MGQAQASATVGLGAHSTALQVGVTVVATLGLIYHNCRCSRNRSFSLSVLARI